MARLYIIDAYNVIFNWPELKELSDQSMELAREKLIEMLTNHSWFTGDQVRVVFDGHLVKGGKGSKKKVGEVEIIFTKSGKTADEVIEKMIQHFGKDTYVVTSDETEQWVTFGRGAWRMTPTEFFQELTASQEKMSDYSQDSSNKSRFLFDRLDSKIREIMERWRREK